MTTATAEKPGVEGRRGSLPSVRAYFSDAYVTRSPNLHEWTAGTASPELIKLVWEGVVPPGSKVLDLGCGIGSESVFLAARGMDVMAIDVAEAAIQTAQKLAAVYSVRIDFRVADALAIPAPDETFDFVCDQGCFHHMSDLERPAYAAEVLRVLKPGGMLVLRSFSDKIPGGPQPRRISSQELIDSFASHFRLEHLERVLSFTTQQRSRPLGWFALWVKPTA